MSPKAKVAHIISVNHNYCTGCGNCIQMCPTHVLAKDTKLNKRGIYAPVVANLDACTGCKTCELFCGNFAIAVGDRPNPKEEGAA